MSKFDIDSLLDFAPPIYMCQKCCALNSPYREILPNEVVCGVCGVQYLASTDFSLWQVYRYLEEVARTSIRFKDPIRHCQALASIARRIRAPSEHYPPMRTLLTAFLQ